MKKITLIILLFLIQGVAFSKDTEPVFANAETVAENAVQTENNKNKDKNDIDYYMNKYKKLKAKNKDEKAFEALKSAYSLDKTNYDTLSEIIKVLINENKPDEAIKYFEQSLLSNPEFESSPEILSYMAQVYILSGDLNNALNYQLKAIELDKDNKENYVTLGKIYLELGKWLNSVNAFEYAISGNIPKDAECYNFIGIANVKRKNYAQAISNFEKSAELKEGFSNLANLAKTYKAKGDWGDYRKTLDKIQLSYLKKPKEFIYLANEYQRINIEKSNEIINKGLELFPKEPTLREMAQRNKK